ncbi:MAG: LysR family transcriptional regulator [Herbaspirillum sp.]|jgi:DNA-binding transcriptional LysR family regulator|nr:LysR family transcriptional regulator [Herbaspirillum sp.]
MLKISLEALQILDAIDRRGSFAGAGAELFRVPSTISYTVAKLEQDLGVLVFERLGPKVKLTTAGEELLKEGRYLLKAAENLEHRVRKVASGWESELSISMELMFEPIALQDDIEAFYQIADRTRLRISQDTLAGSWEALLDRRVDLLIGAAGIGPSGGGYTAIAMGILQFVFAVAPSHPLAAIDKPLGKAELLEHRAIAVADSARKVPARTVGLLFGQNTLTVPNMHNKYLFQLAGLGFGHLPEPYARRALASGQLIEKQTVEQIPHETLYLAWRNGEDGAALAWWIERMKRPGTLQRLFALMPGMQP